MPDQWAHKVIFGTQILDKHIWKFRGHTLVPLLHSLFQSTQKLYTILSLKKHQIQNLLSECILLMEDLQIIAIIRIFKQDRMILSLVVSGL